MLDGMFDIINLKMQSLMNQVMQNLIKDKLDSSDFSNGSTFTSNYWQGSDFSELVRQTALKYDIDPALVQSVVDAESNFNPNAVSHAGAMGLMQLMPGTAEDLGVIDPLDPVQNVDGGVRFLGQLLERYNGNIPLALAAYNAGPGAVDKYGGIPPYDETKLYIQRVLGSLGSINRWEA